MTKVVKVLGLVMACAAAWGQGVAVGRKLPEIQVADKGFLVPRTKVVDGRMVMDGKDIGYRPWASSEGTGRVRTFYHLAARMGIDDVNKAFIDAVIAARLPEFTPDGAYKTISILNVADAVWGTSGMVHHRTEASQREHPHAWFVDDERGVARAAWGLQPRTSAVIVVDRDGTVLFVKEGQLSPAEIGRAISIIKGALGRK